MAKADVAKLLKSLKTEKRSLSTEEEEEMIQLAKGGKLEEEELQMAISELTKLKDPEKKHKKVVQNLEKLAKKSEKKKKK